MLNNWCGQGRLYKDIELRYAGDAAVTTFTVVVERDFKTKDGKREADFIDVVAWRNLAEFVDKWFHKGDMIVIEGRLQTRLFEDKNGNKRKAVEVVADKLNFAGNKLKTEDGEQENEDDAFEDLPEELRDELPF